MGEPVCYNDNCHDCVDDTCTFNGSGVFASKCAYRDVEPPTLNKIRESVGLQPVVTQRTELTANEKIALELTRIWASNGVRSDSVGVVYENFLKRLKKEDN